MNSMSIEMCDYITEEAHSKYETDHRQKKSGKLGTTLTAVRKVSKINEEIGNEVFHFTSHAHSEMLCGGTSNKVESLNEV